MQQIHKITRKQNTHFLKATQSLFTTKGVTETERLIGKLIIACHFTSRSESFRWSQSKSERCRPTAWFSDEVI